VIYVAYHYELKILGAIVGRNRYRGYFKSYKVKKYKHWDYYLNILFLPLTVTRVAVANRGWPESVHLGAIGRRGLAANSAPGKGRAYVARGVPEAPRCTPYIGGERTKAMD